MAHEGVQRYCPTCERPVLAQQPRPNHILHLILTIVTGGLWVVIWGTLGLSRSRPRCTFCGSSKLKRHIPAGRFVAAPGSAAMIYQPEAERPREDAPRISLGLFIIIVVALVVFSVMVFHC